MQRQTFLNNFIISTLKKMNESSAFAIAFAIFFIIGFLVVGFLMTKPGPRELELKLNESTNSTISKSAMIDRFRARLADMKEYAKNSPL